MNAAKACLAAVTALGICVAVPGCASGARSVPAPARPGQVGPVRSARQTDIPILAAYGRAGFAYSGAIPACCRT
jgi:hypothetical protein